MEDRRKLYKAVQAGKACRITFKTTDFDGNKAEYTRLFLPHQRLLLLGGGHISRELCRLAAELDFEVTVADDRPEFACRQRFPRASQVLCGEFGEVIRKLKITAYDFVAVMTRGHEGDGVCLRQILNGIFPAYLGMVGSRKKTALLKQQLTEEGYAPDLLEEMHAPIGLEIGACTPGEIAVSILAQLILCRSRQSKTEEGLLDYCNSDLKLLKFMEETREAYVLAVVIEKSGSAPVAGGALMAVTRDGIAGGTVGGGSGEFEAVREALEVLQTGRSRMMRVNMTNQDAGAQGMICGGTLKLWLEYCGV